MGERDEAFQRRSVFSASCHVGCHLDRLHVLGWGKRKLFSIADEVELFVGGRCSAGAITSQTKRSILMNLARCLHSPCLLRQVAIFFFFFFFYFFFFLFVYLFVCVCAFVCLSVSVVFDIQGEMPVCLNDQV